MDVEGIASALDWRDFEGFVSDILRENSFRVSKNVRFKTDKRHEIDIIAVRGNRLLCIDCKRWRSGRNKRYALIKAVKEQEDRLSEFLNHTDGNPDFGTELGVTKSITNFNTMLITLMQEDIVKEGNTFVIPVQKFNSFILEMEKYL